MTTATKRPPRGSKRLPSGELVSAKDWKKLYVQRSIPIPVAGPIGATWDELRATMRTLFAASTRMHNWIVRHCYVTDQHRENGAEKIHPAKIDTTAIYHAVKTVAPEIRPGVLPQIIQSAVSRYREDRYDVIWTGRKSLPSFRYPTPWQVHNQHWSFVEHRENENSDPVPAIKCNLGGTWYLLRLRGGPGFRRQLAVLHAIQSGAAIQGTISLYEKRSHANDNRSESSFRSRLFVRISAHLPRQAKKERSGTLIVSTGKDWLVQAIVDGREFPWTLHAKHVRRWVAEYRKRMQDMADDQKFERRRPKRQQRDMQEARDRWSNKMRHRLDSITHEASAQLAGLADRQNIAKVVYDDSDRSFVESFPWEELRRKLSYKLDERGIQFEVRESGNGEVTPGRARNSRKEA